MDVGRLAEQLCGSQTPEQDDAWEFLRRNYTSIRQQSMIRQLVGVLLQKYGDTGQHIANLLLQLLADEQNTRDGDVGQLGLMLALDILSEIPTGLFPTQFTDMARALMAHWVKHALPILETLFGPHLKVEGIRIMRVVSAIQHLPLAIVLPPLVEIEQAKARGYFYEETERAYKNLLNVLTLEISPTILLAVLGERVDVSFYTVSTALDQVSASLDIPKIERFFLDPKESEPVRIGAARILEKVNAQASIHSLIRGFHDLLVPKDVQIAALEALAHLGGSEAVSTLVAALRDTDYFIRHTAFKVMGKLGAEIPVESIITVLYEIELPLHFMRQWELLDTSLDLEPVYRAVTDEHTSVREFAVGLLGRCGERAPVELLIKALQDQSEMVRREAANALSNFGERMPQKALFAACHDKDRLVCLNALKALIQSGQPLPVEFLGDAIYNEHLRLNILLLAEEHQLLLPTEALLFALQDHLYGCFDRAARLLARRGPDAPIAQLLAILQDKDTKAHTGAAMALYMLRAYVSPEPILKLLSSGYLKLSASNYLRQLLVYHGIPMSSEAELAFFSQHFLSEELEQDLIATFRQLEEQAPIEELLELLDDRHQRQKAARALSGVYKWITPERLKKVFQHTKADKDLARRILEVPNKPAQSLYAWLGLDQRAPLADLDLREERIFNDLKSSNDRTRSQALSALYTLAWRQPERIFALIRDDVRPPIRETMLFALGRLGKDAPIEVALSALYDNHPRIRASAMLTLQALDVSATQLPLTWLVYLLGDTTDFREPLTRVGITRQQFILFHPDGRFQSLYEEGGTRALALQLLARFGPQAPEDAILPLLGDSHLRISEIAAQVLYTTHPDIFQTVVVPQAEAILRGEPVSGVFAPREYSRVAQAVGWIGRATSGVISVLIDLLDWPYWEVRQQAAGALGSLALRQSLPDPAIQRLGELRHDPQSPLVCQAADEALAAVLFCENN